MASASQTDQAMQISLPGKAWAVRSDAPGFSVEFSGTKPDGRKYLLAKHPSGFAFSITLERVKEPATAAGCRASLSATGGAAPRQFNAVDVKQSRAGEMETLEYFVPEMGGQPVQQKSLFACVAKEDVFVDIHVSKVGWKAEDAPSLESLVRSVRFIATAKTDPADAGPTSFDYMAQGSALYARGEFEKAIVPYQKALDLEKGARKLDVQFWRALVDNLGMAYGMTGKVDAAEAVFQYGISQDPTYPMFHYNMACVYADRRDLDAVKKYLKTAFQYKGNIILGETMPDPRTDDSFRPFLKDESFRKFLDSLR
jgi:tetratricopeptide (TPR) repeat protein